MRVENCNALAYKRSGIVRNKNNSPKNYVNLQYNAMNCYPFSKSDLLFKKNITFSGNVSCTFQDKFPEEKSIQEMMDTVLQDENIIGRGANSVVYNIPYLEGYVLKVLNKDDPNGVDITEFPSDVNLGQPVWQNPENPRMLILKKINGVEHSIPNWSRTIWDSEIYSPLSVTKEQAELYFSQLKLLADMPQSAFDSLAGDVKVLSDMGYKIDSINPNNLIVDNDKNEMHIIDYFKVKPKEKLIYQNSCMDLIAVMLDFTLFPEYYDKLDEESKQSMLECAGIISEKVYEGAKNADLSCDYEKFKKYIRTTSRWFTAHSVPKGMNEVYFRYYDVRLEDFLDMLKNPKQWGQNRT